MITSWLVGLGTSISGWLAGLFANVTLPDFVTTSVPSIISFLDTASGVAVWFPWQVLSLIVAAVITWFVALFAIKLVLFIWARVPFLGGGS